MSNSQRVCQIIPVPTNKGARLAQAQVLASSPTANEGVLLSFRLPEQIVWAGVPSAAGEVPGEFMAESISSSLSTAFYVGPREVGEAALEKWSMDCFAALNNGCCPEDEDQALLGLWAHPSKDVVLVAVLCSGDWAADLEGDLSDEYPDLIQIAYSGNDNDAEVFLPDFLGDAALNHPAQTLCDIAEVVLFNLLPDNHNDTIEILLEGGFDEVVDSFQATQKSLKGVQGPRP